MPLVPPVTRAIFPSNFFITFLPFVRKWLEIPQPIQISYSSQNLPDYKTIFIPFAAVP